MTIEVYLRKRKAAYVGEIGFYANDPAAEEDIRPLANDHDTLHVISSPKNLALQRYLWALITLVTNNTDGRFLDKDDCALQLKLKARFAKLVTNPKTGELELVPKSIKRLSNEQLQRLTNRIVHIVATEIIPDIDQRELRAELERMTS